MNTETTVLNNLILNEEFNRRVIAYISPDYFYNSADRILFQLINHYTKKYNKPPSKEALLIDLQKVTTLTEETYNKCVKTIEEAKKDNTDIEWLIETTEKFCLQKSTHLGIMKAVELYDQSGDINQIPHILSEAISVNFDNRLGHNYLNNSEERFDWYSKKEDKIPFDLEILNTITDGGVSRKTLNCFLAGTGVGKSLTMCHLAASHMMMGYKVLYITLEMSEKAIGQRIDANLLGIDISDLKKTDPVMLKTKMANLRKRCLGELVIQEYPTSTGHVGHFRHLLQELKTKKKFIPDIIYIDYINICASSRYKSLNGVNSYSYIKAIAEELRGLAVEFNLPIITATQSNREAVGNSDIDMDSTSESYGLPMTLDLYLALIATEEMQQQGLISVKQLKNRYNDLNFLRRFVIGIDKARMRLHDVTDDVQQRFYNFTSKKKGRGGL